MQIKQSVQPAEIRTPRPTSQARLNEVAMRLRRLRELSKVDMDVKYLLDLVVARKLEGK